jgi:hypothetical protein
MDISVNECSEKDIVEILYFNQTEDLPSEQKSFKFLKWKYLDNPKGKSIIAKIRFENLMVGRIVLEPFENLFYNSQENFYYLVDLYISPKNRNLINFIMLLNAVKEFVIKNKISLIVNPNDRSIDLYKKVLNFKVEGEEKFTFYVNTSRWKKSKVCLCHKIQKYSDTEYIIHRFLNCPTRTYKFDFVACPAHETILIRIYRSISYGKFSLLMYGGILKSRSGNLDNILNNEKYKLSKFSKVSIGLNDDLSRMKISLPNIVTPKSKRIETLLFNTLQNSVKINLSQIDVF